MSCMGTEATHEQGQMQNEPQALLQKRRPESTACRYRRRGTWCVRSGWTRSSGGRKRLRAQSTGPGSRRAKPYDVYKYRLHDPDSGKVLYEGTAADLAAQGVVVSEKVLPTLWRDQQRQHKRRGKHRWDITREKVEVACSRKAYKVRLKPKKTAAVQAKPPKRPAKPKAAALPVPKPVAPRAPRVRLKKYLTDPTPLQRDVRELEGYNAKARERGKKELSYGYWAAEGKPAAPAW